MNIADLGNVQLHYRDEGEGKPIVFINSLMTDFRLWDRLVETLPDGLRIVRYDKRAHGLSSCPEGPYRMDELVDDLEALMTHLNVSDATVVGLSIGGLIVQGLAARRPDLVGAMVLSNTAAKIATPEVWKTRFEAVEKEGLAAVAEPTIQRWFPPAFRETPEVVGWKNMFLRQTTEAFVYCGHAISGSDYSESTAKLSLPVLGIGGSEDGSTPAELLKETVALVPGSQFHVIQGAGHLPCVDGTEQYSRVLVDFLRKHDRL